MKNKLLLYLFLSMSSLVVNAQKILGGDLSLVPAYEEAGDKWLDADSKDISGTYSDGMITFVHDVAKWNSIRVRLLVDPTTDGKAATCQDLEYVKKLGKRIKDAQMNFLLDIFYSDTWTDVGQQWIPASWNMNRSTDTESLAAKVKSYTTEVVDALVDYGAKPDFIQLGNEVSYGMLWDSFSGKSKNKCFYMSGSYEQYEENIKRFATLLKAAREGVKGSKASSAKIILHCERTLRSSDCSTFYNWVKKAGFDDYDIIGLSYYPFWHGTLTELNATLTELQSSFSDKDIHIVEAGYFNNSGVDATKQDYNTSSTWSYSFEGQAAFLKDLISTLNKYNNVKGLYYWQPEECGNGADANGKNRVMDDWDNRGFWELTWKSGTHSFSGKASLETMQGFLSDPSGINQIVEGQQKSNDYYTLDGRRMNSKPQAKGIYLNNGKKIIINEK